MLTVTDIQRLLSTAQSRLSRSTARRNHRSETGTPLHRLDQGDLKTLIRTRLQELDTNDPAYDKHCRRAFLELTLVWGLGDTVLDDPRYQDVITTLEESIDTDADLQKRFGSLLATLTANQ